jgi:hypothetical protein
VGRFANNRPFFTIDLLAIGAAVVLGGLLASRGLASAVHWLLF